MRAIDFPLVRWTGLRQFPLYQISDEGQVRVVAEHPQWGGKIKSRFWRTWRGNKRGDYVRTPERNNPTMEGGTLYVSLSQSLLDGSNPQNKPRGVRNHRREKSVPRLMDKHWPGVAYPDYWMAGNCSRPPNVVQGRKSKLTTHQLMSIMDDERSPIDLVRSKEYSVGSTWLCRIKRMHSALGLALVADGRAWLTDEEYTYWMESEERGQRIKEKIEAQRC